MDTIRDSCGYVDQPGSTTWIYRTGFAHKVCTNGNCVITDSLVVRTVVQRAMFNGLRKGAITAYCEGYMGFCPAWLDAYDGDSSYLARKVAAVEADDVVTFTPEPMKPRGASDTVGLPEQALTHAADASTRAGQILRLLDSDLKQLTRVFDVEIVEARQAGPNTVEVIYRYPGYDGLLGLRRDVSEQVVGLAPEDRFYALAQNENSPREMATMLRIELEEPPLPDSLTPDAAGIQWRGSPSQ